MRYIHGQAETSYPEKKASPKRQSPKHSSTDLMLSNAQNSFLKKKYKIKKRLSERFDLLLFILDFFKPARAC